MGVGSHILRVLGSAATLAFWGPGFLFGMKLFRCVHDSLERFSQSREMAFLGGGS